MTGHSCKDHDRDQPKHNYSRHGLTPPACHEPALLRRRGSHRLVQRRFTSAERVNDAVLERPWIGARAVREGMRRRPRTGQTCSPQSVKPAQHRGRGGRQAKVFRKPVRI